MVQSKENDEEATINDAVAGLEDSFANLTGPARRNIDYTPINKQVIHFLAGQDEATVTMQLQSASLKDIDGKVLKQAEPISLIVKLSGAQPYGVKLSRNRQCLIRIGNDAYEEDQEVNKDFILKHFLAVQEPSWGQRFKQACVL